jgi:gas vesicle protein
MVERSEEIKNEIEHTREEMGETVDALGYKADVPGRMKGWVGDKKDAVVSTVSGTKDSVTSTVSEKTPDGRQIKQSAGRAKSMAERNPLGLAVAGAALGFIAGLFTPSTQMEDEKLGHMADQVKDSAKEAGQEAMERGKQVAQSAAQSAMDTAKEESREQGDELTSSLQEKARDVPSQSEPQPQSQQFSTP